MRIVGRFSCKMRGQYFRESRVVIPLPEDEAEGFAMRPKERRETGRTICSGRGSTRSSTWTMRWRSSRGDRLALSRERFGAVYTEAGHPPLPTRLMAGLAILKHMHDLSDEELCERWVENPYFQLFCGEEFFQHGCPSTARR